MHEVANTNDPKTDGVARFGKNNLRGVIHPLSRRYSIRINTPYLVSQRHLELLGRRPNPSDYEKDNDMEPASADTP